MCLIGSAGAAPAELIVAADGSGQFRTVQQAVDASPDYAGQRTVIRIRPGTYQQRVVVPKSKQMITLIGDDADAQKTVLTFDLVASVRGEDGKPIGTFGTPSTTIEADDFIGENLTFENSAGPRGQALAITVIGDRAIFRNCRFLGWQDTLLAQTGRHYYERCFIAGHVDFIFGGATAWFQSCQIHCLRNGYITAASTPKDQPWGFVFSNCLITAQDPQVRTLLGRPWRDDASVTWLHTEMPANVSPAGWSNWNRPQREKTARYAEFSTSGQGADVSARAPWARKLTDEEAAAITIDSVLQGYDGWNPRTAERAISMFQPALRPGEDAKPDPDRALVMVTTDSKQRLQLLCSGDGLNWHVAGAILPDAMAQDATLAVGEDGAFHLLFTSGSAGDMSFAYASSKDLRNWSSPKPLNLMDAPNTLDVASPGLFYDKVGRRFIATWASTIGQNHFQSYQDPVNDNPRIWFTTTRDFSSFEPPKVLFEPGYAVRYAQLIEQTGRFYLVHQDHRIMMKDLRVAVADAPTGPWKPSEDRFTREPSTRPVVLRKGSGWLVLYEKPSAKAHAALRTGDWLHFEDVSDQLRMPAGLALGGSAVVSRTAMEALLQSADAAPAKRKRVLFFTRSQGFAHTVVTRQSPDELAHAERIFKELAQREGYDVTVSKDGRLFEAGQIEQWDGFAFYTSGVLTKAEGERENSDKTPPLSPAGLEALFKAIDSGKGLLGFHSTTTIVTRRPEQLLRPIDAPPEEIDPFVQLVGGEFVGHGKQQKATLRVASRALPGLTDLQDIEQLHEEWYATNNLAPDMHVFLVQDTASMFDEQGQRNPLYNRAPYPQTWARMHGQGRVFYTSMGHREDVWTNPVFQRIFLTGLKWICRDTEAELPPNLERACPKLAEQTTQPK